MKKIMFIVLGALLIATYSCQKEDITPKTHNLDDYSNIPENSYTPNRGATSDTFDDGTTNPITDPNRDEDDNKKIKAKPQQ